MADSQQQVVQGVVSAVNASRGFGFIITQDRSLFFHARQVEGGLVLRQGDRVQFTIADSSKLPGKFEAHNVVLLERAATVQK